MNEQSFLERLGHVFSDMGLIQTASSYAAQIDFLILLVLVIVGVWFIAAELIFLYFILRFRAKEGQRGSTSRARRSTTRDGSRSPTSASWPSMC